MWVEPGTLVNSFLIGVTCGIGIAIIIDALGELAGKAIARFIHKRNK